MAFILPGSAFRTDFAGWFKGIRFRIVYAPPVLTNTALEGAVPIDIGFAIASGVFGKGFKMGFQVGVSFSLGPGYDFR